MIAVFGKVIIATVETALGEWRVVYLRRIVVLRGIDRRRRESELRLVGQK